MTATTELSALEDLKRKQHTVWSSGDYNRIAAITVPVAECLTAAAQIRPGSRVLDVATGTGHVALAAAHQFNAVTAVDYVASLVEVGRRRASAEDVDIDIVEADAEDPPFADHSFDVVLSAIGVMFTADHKRAAAELTRVTRPGGTIALASWTPEGFVGQLLKIVGRHVPPPSVAQPPTRWGVPEEVGRLFGAGVDRLRFERHDVLQRWLASGVASDRFVGRVARDRRLGGSSRSSRPPTHHPGDVPDPVAGPARAVGAGPAPEGSRLAVAATRHT